MLMTRQEWTAVAEAIADLRHEIGDAVLDRVACALCRAFARRSSRFDARCFMRIVRGAAK